MKSANAFSQNLKELKPVQVLEAAIQANRLAQAVLLQGDNLQVLEQTALLLASDILGIEPDSVSAYPDVFFLRTRGKSRQITIGSDSEKSGGEWPPNTMRRFIFDLHLSPTAGERKVGIVVEADRMNINTANAFLKTLEEPPADTTLFLLTLRPYDLLDTIRSRCLNFRVPSHLETLDHADWAQWKVDYTEWLTRVANAPRSKDEVAQVTLGLYGLVSRFDLVLTSITESSWETYKENLPEFLSEDEKSALQSGLSKSVRQQLLGEIEQATRDFGIGKSNGHVVFPRRLARTIEQLEHLHILMDKLNLNESTALEAFFLQSLRIWSDRG